MSKRQTHAPPEFYFDAKKGCYHVKIHGRFRTLDKANMTLYLRRAGYSTRAANADDLNEIEKALTAAMIDRAVDYAGGLAGHRVGLFTSSAGKKILVTEEPNPEVFEIPQQPKKQIKHMDRYLTELFGPVQLPYVLYWLKYACKSLRDCDFSPGQILVLAGESGCGKSLFQLLLTELLGGRSAQPFRYMMGETTFNADLAESEHLFIEDPDSSTSTVVRRRFGNAIKDLTVNLNLSVHGKGLKAESLPTYKRVTLSVNKEAENLMVVPPLDESLADKMILLKCNHADLSPDRAENWRLLSGEIPALRWYLHQMKVPEKFRDNRYGATHYHNEELMHLLGDLAPETRLRDLIDEVLFTGDEAWEIWTGSAEELERRLRNSPFGMQVQNLLYFSSACGTYLSRLASKSPRYEARKLKGKTRWTIRQPSE